MLACMHRDRTENHCFVWEWMVAEGTRWIGTQVKRVASYCLLFESCTCTAYLKNFKNQKQLLRSGGSCL